MYLSIRASISWQVALNVMANVEQDHSLTAFASDTKVFIRDVAVCQLSKHQNGITVGTARLLNVQHDRHQVRKQPYAKRSAIVLCMDSSTAERSACGCFKNPTHR
jgi:hypothetical protein